MANRCYVTTWLLVSLVSLLLMPLTLGRTCGGEWLEHVTRETGIDRGVCSMLGFDAETAVQLVQSKRFFLHILDPDPETVAKVKELAEQVELDIDRVVVQRIGSSQLPYADNTIDLILATRADTEDLTDWRPEELLRVLRPGGAAVVGRRLGDEDPEAVGDAFALWTAVPGARSIETPSARLVVLGKPPIEGADQWSHWEHGPDNNPVSTDSVIQAPYLTQFLAEPFYIAMPSITTVAGGRTFLATGHIAHHRREWDTVNRLIARNGYNGTVLWQRNLPDGFLAHRSAFVATEDTFYLLDGDGCLMLDAATGDEQGRIEIPDAPGDWKWMAMDKGVLYAMIGPAGGEAQTIKGDRSFGGWSWADLSRGYYERPHVPWGFGKTIVAYDLRDKRLRWKHDEEQRIDSRAMAMRDGRIYLYCPGTHLRCLNRESGQVEWTRADQEVLQLIEQPGRGLVSTPGFRSACLTVATPEALIMQGQTRMNVIAVSTRDGSLLWSKKKFTNNPNAIYVDGKVVLGVGTRGIHAVIDPATGEVLEEINFRKAACTRLTACPDSFFARGEGTLRFDRETKKVLVDGAVRPACLDGAIPAGGLLYLGPWACDCNLSLIGAMARCSAGDFRLDRADPLPQRLVRGSGDTETVAPFQISENDWPTYRADKQRSASTPVRLATPNRQSDAAPAPRWVYAPKRTYVPTPPVTAGDLVFVAGDDGRVRALDAGTGQLRWQFGTTGPIKASPTVWEGRVFVGSGDGWVYALEAATGRLLWKFRAAPVERLIMIYGNLCSTWPVNTGVLVHDGVAYFAAGLVDTDGTFVYAVDAVTGELRWENKTSGHLSADLRKGVSAHGNLTVHAGHLLMAGGNQVSPARFNLATGECQNEPFTQGNPKANHGKFVGVFHDKYPLLGGRILYSSPRNVANKDSFVMLREGRPITLNFGGVPPAWNDQVLALSDFRDGRLDCFDINKTGQRIEQGFTPPSDRPNPQVRRWSSLAQAFVDDGAARWRTDLDNPNRFEVLALAVTPGHVAAVVQLQMRIRAHPQWQVNAFNSADGTPIWFWRQDLPVEPLPDGLAVGRRGQLVVATLDGSVISLAPTQPRRADVVRD